MLSEALTGAEITVPCASLPDSTTQALLEETRTALTTVEMSSLAVKRTESSRILENEILLKIAHEKVDISECVELRTGNKLSELTEFTCLDLPS